MLDLCPTDDYMLISCMLHPSRRRWRREWWKSGSNASPSSHCTTLLILFSYFYLPSFILSLSKHFITSGTPIYFFEVPAAPPPWALISYSWFLTDCCSTFNNSWNAKVTNKSELFFISVVSTTHKAMRSNQFPILYFLSFVRKHWWCTGGVKSYKTLGFSFWSLLIFFLLLCISLSICFTAIFLLLFILFILCLSFLFNTGFLYNYCL